MPWKECSVVDERLRFVAQLLDSEAMSEVCRANYQTALSDQRADRLHHHPLCARHHRHGRLG
jgi:hypothetical protein